MIYLWGVLLDAPINLQEVPFVHSQDFDHDIVSSHRVAPLVSEEITGDVPLVGPGVDGEVGVLIYHDTRDSIGTALKENRLDDLGLGDSHGHPQGSLELLGIFDDVGVTAPVLYEDMGAFGVHNYPVISQSFSRESSSNSPEAESTSTCFSQSIELPSSFTVTTVTMMDCCLSPLPP